MPSADINRRCFVMQGRTNANTNNLNEAGLDPSTQPQSQISDDPADQVSASLANYFHTTETRSHTQSILEGAAVSQPPAQGELPRNLVRAAQQFQQRDDDAAQQHKRQECECAEAEEGDEELDDVPVIGVAEARVLARPVARIEKDRKTGEVRCWPVGRREEAWRGGGRG